MLFFKRSAPAPTDELALYKDIREASRSWFPKVMNHPATQPFSIFKAARKLGLPISDRTIIFDDELEQAMLMDYYLFDYRPDKLAPAESCTFADGDLKPREVAFHQASLASFTSLYEVVDVHPTQPRFLLRDLLLSPQPDLWLTDVNLTASFRRNGPALLYTRCITVEGLTLTGGFSLGFSPEHKSLLVKNHWQAMYSVPAVRKPGRRTPFFYVQHRRHGLPQAIEKLT
jgi:hypothetical protein